MKVNMQREVVHSSANNDARMIASMTERVYEEKTSS